MRSSFLSRLSVLLLSFVSTSLANNPPTVEIAWPHTNPSTWWRFNEKLFTQARCQDADGTVQRVEFYLNGTLLAGTEKTWVDRDGSQYFQLATANRPAPGDYSLMARAYDDGGTSTDSLAIIVKVEAAALPPSVTTGFAEPTSVSAEIRGALNTHGVITYNRDVVMEYGETTDYGLTTVRGAGNMGNNSDYFAVDGDMESYFRLGNLKRNTTYHCRVVVTNWAGTTYGENLTFTTPANLVPYASDSSWPITGPGPVPISIDFWDQDHGEVVTLTSLSTPAHGTVTVGSDQSWAELTYTPDETFVDTDEFTYTVTDEHGGSTTATVNLANIANSQGGRFVTSVLTDHGALNQVGQLAMNVLPGGRFTGVLFFKGERIPLKGQFSAEGYFEKDLRRPFRPTLFVALSYYGTRHGMGMGGAMHDRKGTYMSTGDVGLTFATDPPEAGAYNIALQPDQSGIPRGNGFLVGRVGKRGQAGFAGRTGDGQPISFGTQLRKGGSIPFFVVAGPTRRDRVQGRFQLPGATGMEVTGNAFWSKIPRTRGDFLEGFNTHLKVTGSRYDAPEGEDPVLDYTDALLKLGIHFSDMDAEALFDAALIAAGSDESSLQLDGAATALSERAARGNLPRPPVKMAINRKRGTFSGTLRLGARASQVKKFQGVILQHQNTGAGYVKLDGGGTGEVVVTPK